MTLKEQCAILIDVLGVVIDQIVKHYETIFTIPNVKYDVKALRKLLLTDASEICAIPIEILKEKNPSGVEHLEQLLNSFQSYLGLAIQKAVTKESITNTTSILATLKIEMAMTLQKARQVTETLE